MSKNVLKAGWVTLKSEEKRLIDSNDLVAKKLESLAEFTDEDGQPSVWHGENFDGTAGGFPEESVDGLVEEYTGDGSSVLDGTEPDGRQQETIRPGGSQQEVSRDAAAQRDQMLQEAQEQIAQMQQEAQVQLEQERQQVLEAARQDGHRQGYEEGLQTGRQEAAEQEAAQQAHLKELEAEYDRKCADLEPLFVDQLTKIYEHVFKTDLSEDKEIIVHLLDAALHNIDSGKNFIVRVSKEDYPFVSMQKKKLLSTLSNATIEFVEDLTLQKNSCLIETGGGIFDCSVDVELYMLRKNLCLLSYENNKEGN